MKLKLEIDFQHIVQIIFYAKNCNLWHEYSKKEKRKKGSEIAQLNLFPISYIS